MKKLKTRISKNQIRRAIRDSGGSKTSIALRCGVSRQTIYRWLKKHPELDDLVKEEQARIADIAISVKLRALSPENKDERLKQKVATEILDRWGKELCWYKPGAFKQEPEGGGVRKIIIEYVDDPEGKNYYEQQGELQTE